MFTHRTPKSLSVETAIPHAHGKWRLVKVSGNYIKSDEPKIQFVTLLATGEYIETKLTDDQRAIIMKELIAAAKRDSTVFRPWENKRRG